MSRLLVALQFGLIALVALRVQPARIGPAFLFLVAAGVAVGGWSALAGVLAVKARREERDLVLRHPGYGEYRAGTRAIIPFLF